MAELHSLELKVNEQAAVFVELGVRMCLNGTSSRTRANSVEKCFKVLHFQDFTA